MSIDSSLLEITFIQNIGMMALSYPRQRKRIHGPFTNDDSILICLTSSTINANSLSHQELLAHNQIQHFTDANVFADFITNSACKIFWITDDEFGKYTVSLLHDLPQIYSIYIFDENQRNDLAVSCSKVQGNFSSLESIENNIVKEIEKIEKQFVAISVMGPVTYERLSDNIDIDKLDPSFMYSQLLKYIILDTDFDQREKDRAFASLNLYHTGNPATLSRIKDFVQKYTEHSPAWW